MLKAIPKKFVVFFVVCMLCGSVVGRPIRIGLFNASQVRGLVISAYNGPLIVSADGRELFVIAEGSAVYAILSDGKILVSDTNGFVGAFVRLSVQGSGNDAVVRLKPVNPKSAARNYEEIVSLYADVDRIKLVNLIDEERYTAGVVEAEVGRGKASEFYKAKAVICRTYLYGHINRHESEGFHLCDETHCQAYKGQSRDAVIKPAVADTREIILTDRENTKPILAAYHSNCGGETESAKNAWQSDLPYLIPVADPYCASQPNARWEKTISLDDWLKYLIKNGFVPDPATVTDFGFQQLRRIADYRVNSFTLPVKKIRGDWQLRSSFFDVSVEDENIVIRGKGYGHGAGLCQEGAMEMGRRGHKYDAIIGFYYKYVNLVPVSSLQIDIPIIE